MNTFNKKAISSELKPFDYTVNIDEKAFIELTKWENDEGYDISINRESGNTLIQLSEGEIEAIDFLRKALLYEKAL